MDSALVSGDRGRSSSVKYRPLLYCGGDGDADEGSVVSSVAAAAALVPPTFVPPATPTAIIRDVMSAAAATQGTPNVQLQLSGGDVAHYALMAKTQAEWQASVDEYRERCNKVLEAQKANAKSKREALQQQVVGLKAQLQASESHLHQATERIQELQDENQRLLQQLNASADVVAATLKPRRMPDDLKAQLDGVLMTDAQFAATAATTATAGGRASLRGPRRPQLIKQQQQQVSMSVILFVVAVWVVVPAVVFYPTTLPAFSLPAFSLPTFSLPAFSFPTLPAYSMFNFSGVVEAVVPAVRLCSEYTSFAYTTVVAHVSVLVARVVTLYAEFFARMMPQLIVG